MSYHFNAVVGTLVTAGGAMGYAKKGSLPSLCVRVRLMAARV
jgi:uncharacterized membrane protein (UPF0136 family)